MRCPRCNSPHTDVRPAVRGHCLTCRFEWSFYDAPPDGSESPADTAFKLSDDEVLVLPPGMKLPHVADPPRIVQGVADLGPPAAETLPPEWCRCGCGGEGKCLDMQHSKLSRPNPVREGFEKMGILAVMRAPIPVRS